MLLDRIDPKAMNVIKLAFQGREFHALPPELIPLILLEAFQRLHRLHSRGLDAAGLWRGITAWPRVTYKS